jgi:hypothetical protein
MISKARGVLANGEALGKYKLKSIGGLKMQVMAEIDRRHAVVLNADDIEKIWSLLQSVNGEVTAEILCGDNIKRSFTELKDLANYETSRSRQILELYFSARSSDYKKSASLRFGSSSFSVSFRAEGPELDILRFKDNIADVTDGLRPWYSIVTRINFYFALVALLLFCSIILRAMVQEGKQGATFIQALTAALIAILVFACSVGLAWGLTKLRERFFPIVTFAIGQGKHRNEFDEKIRWCVIVGFIVSLFATLVAAFLV